MSNSKNAKNKVPELGKDKFLKFLASSSPEEINQYILNKGKPPKLIEPFVYIEDKDDKSN